MEPLRDGEQIDRYVVEAEIGVGGHARVYRVRHVELGLIRALKVLLTTDPGLTSRLLSEGRALASIRHPNVVEVFDVLRVGEQPALVMEFVGGGALSARITGASLDFPEVHRLFRGICAGVGSAHAKGVIHRDIKPDNVLIDDATTPFTPKVSDFGIARSDDDQRTHITHKNRGMGSPLYMAPEQARSAGDVDARADIWSLGVVLYAMLTGDPPFQGADWYEILHAGSARRFKDVRVARPNTPEVLAAVIDACLQPDRDLRPSDVGALLRMLDGAGERRSVARTFNSFEPPVRERPAEIERSPPSPPRTPPVLPGPESATRAQTTRREHVVRTTVAVWALATAALTGWWGLGAPLDALLQSPVLRLAGRSVILEDVVVVGLPETASLPSLRGTYAELLDRLVAAKAAAVVLDVTLSAADPADAEIAAAMSRARVAGTEVILPVRVTGETVSPPDSGAIRSAATLGHVVSLADLDRGWVRSARLVVRSKEGTAYDHVSGLAVAATLRAKVKVQSGELVIGPLRNAAARNRYVFPPAGPATVLPAAGALEAVAGRIVVVGAMQGDMDLHRTADGPAYGCEILAVEIQTLLRQAALRMAPPEVEALCAMALMVASGLLARRSWLIFTLPAVIFVSLSIALAAGGVMVGMAIPALSAAVGVGLGRRGYPPG